MKIGFIAVPLLGHLYPMTALARGLQARGHEITFLGVPDSESIVRDAKLPFVPFLKSEFPQGSMTELWSTVENLHGLEVLEYTLGIILPALLKPTLKHLGRIILEHQVDAMVVDMAYSFVQLIPMRMSMPFVQIWDVLHRDVTGATPPSSFSWPYEKTPSAIERNKAGLKQVGQYFAPLAKIGRAFAAETNMAVNWDDPSATTSKLAVISQTPSVFDFPDISWPPQFHYACPFYNHDGRAAIDFALDQLNSNRLICISLGTVVNSQLPILQTILAAVGQLSTVQAVLSVGRNFEIADLGPLPANMIVVTEAPQVQLLKRASLCITHAGLNTALEALSQGVPMIAIPLGYDQPGVAARIAYHGVGEFVDIEDLTIGYLVNQIKRVITLPGYRAKAVRMRDAFATLNGLEVAADLIEQAFSTGHN